MATGYIRLGHYTLLAAFVVEIVPTTMFVITVLGTTDEKSPAGFTGLAIGLMLTLVHLVGTPVTNTSVNPPVASDRPSWSGWTLHQIWLFIVAPLIGAAIAAAIYRGLEGSGGLITTQRAEEALRSEQVEGESCRDLRLSVIRPSSESTSASMRLSAVPDLYLSRYNANTRSKQ